MKKIVFFLGIEYSFIFSFSIIYNKNSNSKTERTIHAKWSLHKVWRSGVWMALKAQANVVEKRFVRHSRSVRSTALIGNLSHENHSMLFDSFDWIINNWHCNFRILLVIKRKKIFLPCSNMNLVSRNLIIRFARDLKNLINAAATFKE